MPPPTRRKARNAARAPLDDDLRDASSGAAAVRSGSNAREGQNANSTVSRVVSSPLRSTPAKPSFAAATIASSGSSSSAPANGHSFASSGNPADTPLGAAASSAFSFSSAAATFPSQLAPPSAAPAWMVRRRNRRQRRAVKALLNAGADRGFAALAGVFERAARSYVTEPIVALILVVSAAVATVTKFWREKVEPLVPMWAIRLMTRLASLLAAFLCDCAVSVVRLPSNLGLFFHHYILGADTATCGDAIADAAVLDHELVIWLERRRQEVSNGANAGTFAAAADAPVSLFAVPGPHITLAPPDSLPAVDMQFVERLAHGYAPPTPPLTAAPTATQVTVTPPGAGFDPIVQPRVSPAAGLNQSGSSPSLESHQFTGPPPWGASDDDYAYGDINNDDTNSSDEHAFASSSSETDDDAEDTPHRGPNRAAVRSVTAAGESSDGVSLSLGRRIWQEFTAGVFFWRGAARMHKKVDSACAAADSKNANGGVASGSRGDMVPRGLAGVMQRSTGFTSGYESGDGGASTAAGSPPFRRLSHVAVAGLGSLSPSPSAITGTPRLSTAPLQPVLSAGAHAPSAVAAVDAPALQPHGLKHDALYSSLSSTEDSETYFLARHERALQQREALTWTRAGGTRTVQKKRRHRKNVSASLAILANQPSRGPRGGSVSHASDGIRNGATTNRATGLDSTGYLPPARMVNGRVNDCYSSDDVTPSTWSAGPAPRGSVRGPKDGDSSRGAATKRASSCPAADGRSGGSFAARIARRVQLSRLPPTIMLLPSTVFSTANHIATTASDATGVRVTAPPFVARFRRRAAVAELAAPPQPQTSETVIGGASANGGPGHTGPAPAFLPLLGLTRPHVADAVHRARQQQQMGTTTSDDEMAPPPHFGAQGHGRGFALTGSRQHGHGHGSHNHVPRTVPLPRQPRRGILALDLDETLMHSSAHCVPPPATLTARLAELKATGALPATAEWQWAPPAGHDFCELVPTSHGGELYYVWLRPHARTFLSCVSQWFTVVIFTASTAEYAKPIVQRVDIDCTVQRIFSREYCYKRLKAVPPSAAAKAVVAEKKPAAVSGLTAATTTTVYGSEYVKDLSRVVSSMGAFDANGHTSASAAGATGGGAGGGGAGSKAGGGGAAAAGAQGAGGADLSRAVLIDNLEHSFVQPDNGIRIRSFEPGAARARFVLAGVSPSGTTTAGSIGCAAQTATGVTTAAAPAGGSLAVPPSSRSPDDWKQLHYFADGTAVSPTADAVGAEDRSLLDMLPLLEALAVVPDVRHILGRRLRVVG